MFYGYMNFCWSWVQFGYISALNTEASTFRSLGNYRDSEDLEQECYQKIFALKNGEKYFGRTHTVLPFASETEKNEIVIETDSDNFCPSCGSRISDTDSAFCNKCGFKLHELPTEADDTDPTGGFCRNCGKPLLSTGLEFCPYYSADNRQQENSFIENNEKYAVYKDALAKLNISNDTYTLHKACDAFWSLNGYRDSETMAKACQSKIDKISFASDFS